MKRLLPERVKKLLLTLFFLLLCLGGNLSYTWGILHANGQAPEREAKKTEGKEDPCAELKKRLARLEAEKQAKKAKKKPATAARKTTPKKAAKKPTTKKTTVAKAKKPSATSIKTSTRKTAGKDAWIAARHLVEEGRHRKAIFVLRKYLAENPRSTDGWYWIARAYHAVGDYDRAQDAANAALRIDPHYPALTKTPSGLQPVPRPRRSARHEPRPSMSVLPVKPPVPSKLALEPLTISFPVLVNSEDVPTSADLAELFEAEMSGSKARDPHTGAWLRYDPYPPLSRGLSVAWQQNERFHEISRWRFRVDRMGILEEPRVPVAWKGTFPYEVYFWTGNEWARARRKTAFAYVERFDDILFRAKEDIEKILAERNHHWFEKDTPSLAANASAMRYWWQGDIKLDEAKGRYEKRQKEKTILVPARSTDKEAKAK